MPGTDRFAFGAAKADIRINPGGSVFEFARRTPRAEIRTGGILTVHASPGDCKGLLPAINHHSGLLDKQPVIRGQPVCDISLVRPVRNLDFAWIHSWERLLWLGEFRLIHFLTCLHACPAPDTFSDINKGCQFLPGICLHRGREWNRGGCHGPCCGQTSFKKGSS